MKLCLRDRRAPRSYFHLILLLAIAGGALFGCRGNSAELFPKDWNVNDPPGPHPQSLETPSSASVSASIVGGLQRQADCSLTYFDFSYTAGPTAVTVTPHSQIANYEKILHDAANLETMPGWFPEGCADASPGVTSRPLLFLGIARDGRELVAVPGASGVVTSGLKIDGSFTPPATQATPIPPVSLLSGDLNRAGNADLISINSNGSRSSMTVFLGKGDGTFQPGIDYALPGANARYGVLDDMNGDGILDLLVSSESPALVFSIFIGNGDGTFQPPQTFTPAEANTHSNVAFTTADVNGDGARDIVTAQGQIFLGNGDGIRYTRMSQAAFPPILTATNGFAPSIVAADFNHDGITDLATDDGLTVRIYLGNGNGTFTAGQVYPAISNSGFLTATDLDGDGNVDLWSGNAGNGVYGGDASLPHVAYALMGNGDGTFQGVPGLPETGFAGASFAEVQPVRDAAANLALSAPSPSKLSVASGQTAAPFSVTVSSPSGTAQSVSFACSGLPALATCSFQPNLVNLSATVISSPVSVTIGTASSAVVVPGRRFLPPSEWPMPLLVCGLLALPIALFRARSRRARWAVSACLLLLVFTPLGGCMNNSSSSLPPNFTGTPPGIYAVTVTAVGATTVSAPSTLTLTVTAP